MNLEENSSCCQIPSLQLLAEGVVEVPTESFGRRLKLMVRRHLSPERERAFKNHTNKWMNRLYEFAGKSAKPPVTTPRPLASRLAAGDLVRVRSRKEIEDTLNHWRQVRGCAFMPEMAEYCGTNQRVFESMSTFVDERDLRVKRSKGIMLLEGVICKGTKEFGSCDRSCLHFWREEWLEKITDGAASSAGIAPNPETSGTFVKIRPYSEIENTFDRNRQRKGCSFLPQMAKYCGTVQRILKPVRRFVDERDLRVKRCTGIIVLEGVMCDGASESVRCNRCCHLLWREEWLEEIDVKEVQNQPEYQPPTTSLDQHSSR